jgi:DNA-directed RNA polymerase II subunit RPB2
MWSDDFKQYFYDNDKSEEHNILTKHHLESYNDFISNKIPEIINSKAYNPLIIDTVDHLNAVIKIELHIKINDDNFKVDSDLFPNDYRLNNLTYQGEYKIDYKIRYLKNNNLIKEILLENITLASIPICILSNYCNLVNIPRNKFPNYNECSYELGGYYIINGKEKTIISQDRLVTNKLYIHSGTYPDKYVTEIKSGKISGFEMEQNTYIKYRESKIDKIKLAFQLPLDKNISKDGSPIEDNSQDKEQDIEDVSEKIILEDIEEEEEEVDIKSYSDFTSQTNDIKEIDTSKFKFMISFPGIQDIPLFILFRALGFESDKEILSVILFDEIEYIKHIYLNILEPTLKDSYPIMSQQSALKYILHYSAYNTVNELIGIMNTNLLPLYSNNYSKFIYLGYMVNRSLQVIAGYKPTSDRDNLLNKRISTSGNLFAKLFREWFIAFTLNARRVMTNISTNINLDTNIIFTELDFVKLIDKGGNQNLITDGIQKGFRGNWGTKVFNKKITVENIHERVNTNRYKHSTDGIVQELDKLNYFRSVYHLRQIVTPIDKTLKVYGPRRLNLTQFGFICPTDTPDGGSCGLTKNLALGCQITEFIKFDKNLLLNILSLDENFIPVNNIIFANNYNSYYIFCNGEIVGIYNNNKQVFKLYNIFKLLKRNNILFHHLTSILINTLDKEIRIATDPGRCVRPVYVVYNGQKLRDLYDKNTDLDQLLRTKTPSIININNLFNKKFIEKLEKEQSPIELIDADEQFYTLIAMNETILNNDPEKYYYLELDVSLCFSAVTNLMPFVNHNLTQRTQVAVGQLKQAVGITASNFNQRMDNVANILDYPQKSISNTKLLQLLNHNQLPTGVNINVAIITNTGYNIEDAFIFNKGSIERGLFCNTYYRTYIEVISADKNEQFTKPEPQFRKKNYNYSKLDENGIITVGTYINDNDIIIGKLTSVVNDTVEYRDNSATIHHGDEGIVDKVIRGIDQFHQEFVKVRMIMWRCPIEGDKIGARHYLKGVIGSIMEEADVPFTKDGIQPDLMINPAGIPTRQTTGILIEMIVSLAMSNLGMFFDGSPFSNVDFNIIFDLLETPNININRTGHNILYHGITGEQLEADIFMGICYYQRFKQMVSDKVQSRATGPYAALDKQPVKGRGRGGGLRLGEMEINSFISHGLCEFLYESITKRSDDYICYVSKKSGLIVPYNYIKQYNPNNEEIIPLKLPYSTKLFIQELQQMAIAVKLFI